MYFNTGYGSCGLLRAVLHIYLLYAQDYGKVLAVNMLLTKCIYAPLHTRHNFCTLILGTQLEMLSDFFFVLLMHSYLQVQLAAGNGLINAPSEELQQYLCFWKAYHNQTCTAR